MIRLLLVEDDPDIRAGICADLKRLDDYRVTEADSAEKALGFGDSFDIILLDIMLPGRSGLELCTLLRKRCACPILFLSALDDSATIVEAFGCGGDDYVVKPYDPAILHARLQANLRRVRMERQAREGGGLISCAGWALDTRENVLRRQGCADVRLLPIEARLLAFLMAHEGSCFKARELYREIWGQDDLGNNKTVLVHMHNLRARVEDIPEQPTHLLNIRGKGYTFHA